MRGRRWGPGRWGPGPWGPGRDGPASDQPPVDRTPADPAQLGTARERARHVVVLMLENRSFDHLLAFSGHPGLTALDPSRHANRVPDQPGDPEPPHASGSAMLSEDPPHSHDAAKRQMGTLVAGVASMDGFVEAHRLKLDGNEHLPVIRWPRLFGAALVMSPLLGGAAKNLVRRAHHGWGGFAPWWSVPTGALAVGALARPFGRASRVPRHRIAAGVLVGGTVIGAGSEAVVRAGRDRYAGMVWWTAPAALALAAVVERQRTEQARRRVPRPGATERAREVMGCLPAEEVPVLSGLAKRFAVCERWFSSVPGATWPNRNFLHAGTSAQSVDIEVGLYQDRTIFELLDDSARHAARHDGALTDPPWRIYADGTPQVLCFERLWRAPEQAGRWCGMDDFFRHAGEGALAAYSFIEPRHGGGSSNSMHPGNNTALGEDGKADADRAEILVKDVYEAIGRFPGGWESTVLVVTFDEHGGTFDRVPPPKTVPPDIAAAARHPVLSLRRFVAWFVEHRNAPFDFRRYGIRVPTLVISPWVGEGSVDRHDYDHTSVPETIRQLFAPDEAPLGRRAERARPFWDLLVTSARPRPMPPSPAPRLGPRVQPTPEVEARAGRPRPDAVDAADATTGGDLEAQLSRLEELATVELDRRLGAGVTTRAGPATIVERFRRWARQAGGDPSDDDGARARRP